MTRNTSVPALRVDTNNISHGTFLAILRGLYLRRNWWWIALPPAVCMALGVVAGRFLFVALIVLLMEVVFVLPFVYYYYALIPESRWSLMPKTVTVAHEGLRLDFDDEKMRSHTVVWREIAGTRVAKGCLLLMLARNRFTFVAIPLSAFGDPELLREFVLTVNKSCEKVR